MSVQSRYRLMRYTMVWLRRLGSRYQVNVENAWESSAKADREQAPGPWTRS